MDLQFRLPDTADDSELERFHDWLLRDRNLRTSSEIAALPAPPTPDGMGLSLDAVELILNSGFQLASLAVAIVSWRKAVEPRSAMTVRRGDVEVRLDRADLEDVRTVLNALERLPEAGGGRGAPDHQGGAP